MGVYFFFSRPSHPPSALDSDSYNGAMRDKYQWSQDYNDVEVRVFVPKEVVKGKQVSAGNGGGNGGGNSGDETCVRAPTQVNVSLQSGGMRVCVRVGPEEQTLVEGKFSHKINTENSLWSLEPGKCVVVMDHFGPYSLHALPCNFSPAQ